MFSKNMIISGFVSSAMFAAAAFATPASAGQALFRLGAGINGLLNELIETNERAPNVHNIDYRGVPIRKIHRKMLRRGLYPVSEYRLRGDVVILRAEDDSGTLFRVVADAGYGDIIRIRRVDEVSRRRRPVPVDPHIMMMIIVRDMTDLPDGTSVVTIATMLSRKHARTRNFVPMQNARLR